MHDRSNMLIHVKCLEHHLVPWVPCLSQFSTLSLCTCICMHTHTYAHTSPHAGVGMNTHTLTHTCIHTLLPKALMVSLGAFLVGMFSRREKSHPPGSIYFVFRSSSMRRNIDWVLLYVRHCLRDWCILFQNSHCVWEATVGSHPSCHPLTWLAQHSGLGRPPAWAASLWEDRTA